MTVLSLRQPVISTFEQAIQQKAMGDAALSYALHGDDPYRLKNFWEGYHRGLLYLELKRIGLWQDSYELLYAEAFLSVWDQLSASQATARMAAYP